MRENPGEERANMEQIRLLVLPVIDTVRVTRSRQSGVKVRSTSGQIDRFDDLNLTVDGDN